jgi:hypothetical protein
MALVRSLGALAGVAILGLLFVSFGRRLLRWTKTPSLSLVEDLLLSAAAGVVAFEVGVALVSYTGKLRIGIGVLLILVFVAAIPETRGVFRDLAVTVRGANRSPIEKALAAMVFLVALLEGMSAMAPLTGSDALHYHFTTAQFYLKDGFRPNFFVVHSFFFGQSHQLILTGLSLGSEKLALGLVYLGGVLAAGAAACVARRWAPPAYGWLAALALLVTPVVFWQMTLSGAPDVWMAFFATVAVICIASYREQPRVGLALWAGVLAGAVAGAKYTGCVIAASLGLAFLWEARSLRPQMLFFGGALCAGIWPYARNFFWTGDPFFPFGVRWFTPDNINHFTLAAVMLNTGASRHTGALKFLSLATFAAFDPARPGFFQYFGPLCLVFAPLVALAIRNTSLRRAVAIVWLGSSVGIALTSDTARFLLPVYPIALAASVSSVARLRESSWKLAKTLSLATVGSVLLMGIAGLLIYERYPLAVSAGLMSREEYLQQSAPDYERAEFVNQALVGKGSSEKALVFFRHIYYLNVPFVYGDPGGSWPIDPEKLESPEAWLALFHRENIRWVVRSPEYPEAVAAGLSQLERAGALASVVEGQTAEFVGKRIEGVKRTTPIVILRVQD